MLKRIGLICMLLVLSGCTTPPTTGVAEKDVKLMIERFGPLLYLHNSERYWPDDPKYVLDVGASLCWGIVIDDESDNDNYDKFECKNIQQKPTSSKTLVDDARAVAELFRSNPDSSNCKYWLRIGESFKEGNLSRAKALVHVLPAGESATELQFWFYYPFNGPGRVRVRASGASTPHDTWLNQCGRHYGDWEVVSIVVSNTATELMSVYLSRHSEGETFNRREDGTYTSTSDPERKLQITDGLTASYNLKLPYPAHPVVYSAISSHAHYPNAGDQIYRRVFSLDYKLGTASADLFDKTEAGPLIRAYDVANYSIISSDMPRFAVTEPKWLGYDGRWGQYEKLIDEIGYGIIKRVYTEKEVGRGVTGPKMQPKWSGAFRTQ